MSEYVFVGGLQAGRRVPGRALFVFSLLGVWALSLMFFLHPAFAGGFSDVRGHWAAEEIEKALSRGYVKGFPDGTFHPDRGITRAEFVTMVNGAFQISGDSGGGPTFSDVHSGDWFAGAVQAAASTGYIKGYPDGTFRPLQKINRQEAASILMGVLKVEGTAPLQFTDAWQIASWARSAVASLVAKGVINGLPDGSFQPLRTITRSEAVVMINGGLKVKDGNQQQEPGVTPVKLYLTVTGSVVNIRSGPGTGYNILGQVHCGDLLEATARSTNNWYRLEFQGKTGWITGEYVEVHETRPPQRGDPGTLEVQAASQTGGILITLAGGSETKYSWEETDGRLVVTVPGVTVVRTPLEIVVGKAGVDRVVTKFSPDQPGVALVEVSFSEEPLPVFYRVEEASPGELRIGVPNQINRIEARVEGEEVVLRLSGTAPLDYRVLTLLDPRRLVFDFAGFAVHPSLLNWRESIDLDGFTEARVGQFQVDVARLVVEVNRRVSYTVVKGSGNLDLTLRLKVAGAAGACVVIDPGHGGSEPGAIGPSGLKEKDVNLAIAKKVVEILQGQGYEVVLTRDGDYDVDLLPRAQLANDLGAAAFVSIHSNASVNPGVGGTGTYTYAPSGTSLGQQRDDRLYLARLLQEEMVSALGLRDAGVFEENFSVLRNTVMPAALCEVAFISNYDEERLLASDDFQRKAAEAVARGITRFLAG